MYWAGVLCAFLAALTAFGLIKRPSGHGIIVQKTYGSAFSSGRQRFATLPGGVPSGQRRLYPYSVVPGGVQSPEELRNAVAHDPLVAGLYANFDFSHARVATLTHDREVYVSYRFDNHIYWTKKRLLLRAGETVITDGTREGRTRCGNRISETPMQPVRQDEPTNAAVNTPASVVAENRDLLPMVPLGVDPVGRGLPVLALSSPPVSMIPPPVFPIVGGGPTSFPSVIPPPPPIAAPEPGVLPLLGLGLIAFGLAGILTIRKPGKA